MAEDKVYAGGSKNFDESTGAAKFDFDAAEKQRARLEMEMKRSDQGSKRQKEFADKLAAQRTLIQQNKQSQGMELKKAQGVTGQQMVDTLAKRAEAAKAPPKNNTPVGGSTGGGGGKPGGSSSSPVAPPAAQPPAAQPPVQQPPVQGQPQQPGQPSQPGQPNVPGMSPPLQTPGGNNGYGAPNYGGSNPYGGYGNLPGTYASGWGNMPAPNLPAYQYQGDQSGQMLGGVYDSATNGTINQFNTAANRIRERLDSSASADLQGAQARNLSRGFGDSGAQDQAAYQVGANKQNAYANALTDLSTNFENLRQQGLQTALGAANSVQQGGLARNQLGQQDLSQLRGLNNSNFQFLSGQDLQNRQFMDQTLFNLINNREQRGSNETISGNELASREREGAANRQFTGNQNNQDRNLQETLNQLQEQNNNWRNSLNQLLSNPSLFQGGGVPNLGNIPTNLTPGSGLPTYGSGSGKIVNAGY